MASKKNPSIDTLNDDDGEMLKFPFWDTPNAILILCQENRYDQSLGKCSQEQVLILPCCVLLGHTNLAGSELADLLL